MKITHAELNAAFDIHAALAEVETELTHFLTSEQAMKLYRFLFTALIIFVTVGVIVYNVAAFVFARREKIQQVAVEAIETVKETAQNATGLVRQAYDQAEALLTPVAAPVATPVATPEVEYEYDEDDDYEEEEDEDFYPYGDETDLDVSPADAAAVAALTAEEQEANVQKNLEAIMTFAHYRLG